MTALHRLAAVKWMDKRNRMPVPHGSVPKILTMSVCAATRAAARHRRARASSKVDDGVCADVVALIAVGQGVGTSGSGMVE